MADDFERVRNALERVDTLRDLLESSTLNPAAILETLDDVLEELDFITDIIAFRRERRATVMTLYNDGYSVNEIVGETGYKRKRVVKILRHNSGMHRGHR